MNLTEFINQISWLSSLRVTVIDVIQMIILAFVLNQLIKSLYKTRGWILVKGLVIVGAAYLFISLTGMSVLQSIMKGLFSTFLIAIVIMLQPELQKLVESLGTQQLPSIKSLFKKNIKRISWYSEKTIDEVVTACVEMGKVKTGALIVFERSIPLKEYIQSGLEIKAKVSSQLLINIFEKNTPLHDGAVVIRKDIIESATSYLPLSTNQNVNKKLGTRHRAAIGASESTDCLVVSVSEETGALSVSIHGEIFHNINETKLKELMMKYMYPSEERLVTMKKEHSPFWMKWASLALTIVIWFSVVSMIDPVTTTVVSNVAVNTINTEVLDSLDKVYTIDSNETIDVTLEGRRSLINKVSAEDIIASADFEEMSSVNAVPIHVAMVPSYDDLEIVSQPLIMKLTIEDKVQAELPIEVEIVNGTNKNGVACLDHLESKTLMVTCPQSLSKRLSKAVVTVDAHDKKEAFEATVVPVIYDKNGDVVTSDKLVAVQKDIKVYVNIYKTKKVPVSISLSEQQIGSDVYFILNGYESEVDEIELAADDATLATLSDIPIAISPDPKSENPNSVVVDLSQYIPEGTYLAKDQDDKLEIKLNLVKYEKKAFKIKKEDIAIVGYDTEKLKAEILEFPQTINVYCDSSKIKKDSIVASDLKLKMDIARKGVGTYIDPLTLSDVEGAVFVGDIPTVKYTLIRK